jgi:hypothetical protein
MDRLYPTQIYKFETLGLMHQQGDMLLGLIWEEELAAFQV